MTFATHCSHQVPYGNGPRIGRTCPCPFFFFHPLSNSRKWPRLRSVPTTSDLERMLRGVALRVTRPRVAVLSAVHDHPHADTDSIIAVVREDLGEVSHQAVYDVLRALTVAGLVRRIQPTGSVARYESRVGDNHHHVVCRSCGAIADVDCAVGTTPCLTASDDHGFTIEDAEVVYWGRCPECAAATAVSSDGSKRTRGVRHQLGSAALDPEH
jgi:Fur family transcriptional regulator, stress-responsive regulator